MSYNISNSKKLDKAVVDYILDLLPTEAQKRYQTYLKCDVDESYLKKLIIDKNTNLDDLKGKTSNPAGTTTQLFEKNVNSGNYKTALELAKNLKPQFHKELKYVLKSIHAFPATF